MGIEKKVNFVSALKLFEEKKKRGENITPTSFPSLQWSEKIFKSCKADHFTLLESKFSVLSLFLSAVFSHTSALNNK